MLQLTDSAKDAVRDIVAAEQGTQDSGLRIASEGSSDDGPALSMAVTGAPTDGDAVIDQGDIRLFLDSTAAAFLDDKVLDAEAHGDHFHFSIDEQDGAES